MRLTSPNEIRTAEDVLFLTPSFRARKRLEIDLSQVEWISPLGIVAVLSACLGARSREVTVTVELPVNQRVRTYLHRIGVFDELERNGFGLLEELQLDPAFELAAGLPVSSLSTEREVEEAANRLEEELRRNAVAPGMFQKVMDVSVELTQNAREHGSACYMVVQTHSGETSGTPGIHVAVADFGPGFAATLGTDGRW